HLARGIIEIAGEDGLRGANDDAGRLQFRFHAVRAEIALGCGIAVGIDVKRVVGAGLHAAFATDAALIVEVDNSVGSSVEGVGGANGGAGRIVAVVTSHHAEMTAGVGKLAFLDVLDPGAKNAHRNLMFLLARHRAGVTPNTSVLIDNKPVAHSERFS